MEHPSYRPIPLTRNRRYPTYQLVAESVNRNTPADDALKIGILTVLAWLRERFRELEIPDELQSPPPDAYDAVSPDSFSSVHLQQGYVLDIISLPRHGIWALQLIEPDLGVETPGAPAPRAPVPGRLVETHIGFRVTDSHVACGFQIQVSEPEFLNVDAEVFRPGVVKRLVRHPRFGLRHEYPIQDEPHRVDTTAKVRRLSAFLDSPDRILPTVLFFESDPAPTAVLPLLDRISREHLTDPRPWADPHPPAALMNGEAPRADTGSLPYPADTLAHLRMGYAQFFQIHHALLQECRKQFERTTLQPGDILLCEAARYGGKCRKWSHDAFFNSDDMEQQVGDLIQTQLRRRDVPFDSVLFTTGALQFEAQQRHRTRQTQRQLQYELSSREQQLNREWTRRLQEEQQNTCEKERRIRKQSEEISRLNREVNRLRSSAEEQSATWQRRHQEQEEELAYWKRRQDRPTDTEGIPDWVRQNFSGRLWFHPRACDLISGTPTSEVNLSLLCDALEYLAQEYRDTLAGTLTTDEANNRCSRRYGRPFEVIKTGDTTIAAYPEDYRIKYKPDPGRKGSERDLDLHLKVGNTNEHLIRIYFFYDTERKLIVVGSLPRHLRLLWY